MDEGRGALERRARPASRRVLAAAAWAGLLLLAPPRGALVLAADSGFAIGSIDVGLRTVANVTDLRAQLGPVRNSVQLTWTEPRASGHTLPTAYDLRVSSTGNITSNGEFQSSPPSSAFSGTQLPAPGPGGGQSLLVLTGLNPATTYYFALRESDNSAPKLVSAWHRNEAKGWNVYNWSLPLFLPGDPNPVTNLAGFGAAGGQALLQWTAPEGGDAPRPGRSAMSYKIHYATFSIADLGGDTTAWFNASVEYPAPPIPLPPGSLQTMLITNLPPAVINYFAMKSVNFASNTSDIDSMAYTVNQAKVDVRGIAAVTNLTALPGAAPGTVDLVWTQPRRSGTTEPSYYDIRASTTGQISSNAEFSAAQPLTAFSPSVPPAPGAGGTTAVLTVTGLTPSTTYYFAIRTRDHGAIPFAGNWQRDQAAGLNPFNFSPARYLPALPEPVTDLAALPGSVPASVAVNWTAPRNLNGVPMLRYVLKMSTQSIADLGGDTTAWFDLATSTTWVLAARPPGERVSLEVPLLDFRKYYYFGIRSIDAVDETSLIDVRAAGVASQARSRPRYTPPVTDLTAIAGAASGSIQLAWTEPDDRGLIPPRFYEVRVSSMGNISGNADFDAAQPLSSFSRTPPPVPGPGGTRGAAVVTGLIPNVTYYFALREIDSNPIPILSDWVRDLALGYNQANFGPAGFVPHDPDAITDLTAFTASGQGRLDLAWTAPRNVNFVPISSYVVRLATFSVAQVGGSTATWFASAPEERWLAPAKEPGGLETLAVSGLAPGTLYFLAVRAKDREAELGPVDLRALGAATQARALAGGMGPVTDLLAATGSGPAGSVDLSWTEPQRSGTVLPERYVLKASSAANIGDSTAFEAAAPLSALSGTPLPPVGAPGTPRLLTVTGLPPFTTYYFAVRAEDSSAPVQAGRWLRDLTAGWNAVNYATSRFVPGTPEPITDLTALQGTADEGDVRLSWTAPLNRNFVPISRYEVRYATVPVGALGGDTTAWLALAASGAVRKAPAGAPGSLETLTVKGLYPSSTFYFAVRSYDQVDELSPVDTRTAAAGAQAFSKPLNLPPGTPSGLTALAGLSRVSLSWTELPAGPAGKGLDFARYFLLRSTMPASGYAEVFAGAGLTLLDRPLDAFTTYYYRVGARDSEGLTSPLSAAVQAMPSTLAPLQPFGMRISSDAVNTTVSWNPTVRFAEGTLFASTSAPAADELTGYDVFRTTDYCSGFQHLASLPVGVTSVTHPTGGQAYWYLFRSTNAWFASEDSLFLSPYGDQVFVLSDCIGRVEVEQRQAELLNREATGLPEDIAIIRRLEPESTGGKVYQSATFKPMLGGHSEVKGFHFDKAVKVILHYAADADGRPVPQAEAAAAAAKAASGQRASGAASAQAAAVASKDLGIFWNNGSDFKKLYGRVDPAAQTVTAETPNIGEFQIRSVYRDSGVTFDLSNLSSRVLTPNNDGKNDLVIFTFDNPDNAPITGKIYDLRGAFVATMQAGTERGLAPNQLVWDGTMNGKIVTSGVYIYQIEGGGKTFNGTLVVAR